MTRVEWNEPGTSLYETGCDRGMFYPRVGDGVPWNGLVNVQEAPKGGEHESFYFDGAKYHNFIAAEDFEAVVEAYAAPEGFAACDGAKQLAPGLLATQQLRAQFNFCYRNLIGNEIDDTLGYKIHLVYNCKAGPSSRSYSTISRTPTAPTRSWTFYTVPPAASTFKPTAHFVVDSRATDPAKLTTLEDQLYGSPSNPPTMPTQAQVISILS